MNKVRILVTFFCMLSLVQGVYAQTQESGDLMEMRNLIRKQKFDQILPQAMRDNKVDMWIQVMRAGNPDPLSFDLGGRVHSNADLYEALQSSRSDLHGGSTQAYFIFTDRGGDRIERAILGGEGPSDVYNIFGAVKDLRKFVAERDPKRIAVNYSERHAFADGLSHTGYLKLVKALGEKYAERLVSAYDVISDFRSKRVTSEIVFYGQLCRETVEKQERALSQIKPGVTTVGEAGVEGRDSRHGKGYDLPSDHVIQGGDLFNAPKGISKLNYGTDIERTAYVLREGETTLPPEIKKVFDETLKARKIFCKNIKVGRTAGETVDILKRKFEEAGFIFNHPPQVNIDTGYELVDPCQWNTDADPEKTQIFIDMHPVGNEGYGDGGVGPYISYTAPDQAYQKIPPNFFLSLEYGVLMPVPKWGKGKYVIIHYEDTVIITENGVEFFYPPMDHIRLIH